MNSSFIHDSGDDAGDPRRLYALRDKNREFCISGLRFRQLSYRIAPFGNENLQRTIVRRIEEQ